MGEIMRTVFRTNLDSNKRDVQELNEVWPRLGSNRLPRVGDVFRFDRCELSVHRVTYDVAAGVIEIELHVPSWFTGSIRDWEERMRATGRRW